MEDTIIEKWLSMSCDENIYKSPFSAWETKPIDGKLNLLVRYSDPHWGAKRGGRHNPERVSVLKQFDSDKFNFTKVKNDEVISSFGEEQQHVILFNVSPMLMGHSLIIPFLNECYPQVMYEKGLQVGIDFISKCSQNTNSYLLFNSLGAFASVNHFHFHYVRQCLPALSRQRISTKTKGIYLLDFPTDVIVFSVSELGVSVIFLCINYLSNRNVAFNVVITPSMDVFVTPRKNQFYNTGIHRIAVIEILGCATAGTREEFDQITEQSFVKTLKNEIKLPEEDYHNILNDIHDIISSKSLV